MKSAVRTIAFLNQKGGSGKTTLAVHTAVAAQRAGERVLLIDADPQASAMAWSAVRKHDMPAAVHASPNEIGRVLEGARGNRVSLALIDMAPHASPGAARAAEIADAILIPCRPSAFDLAAAGAAVDLVRVLGKPAAFVLNACPSRAPEVAEAREALRGLGITVAPVEIGQRRAYARAVASGLSVNEFDGSCLAAREITALWKWIKKEYQL